MADNEKLETKCSDLEADVEKVEQTLREVINSKSAQQPTSRLSDGNLKKAEYEATIEELKLKLEESDQKLQEISCLHSRATSKIEELREQNLCLEENLESKKSDLIEKKDLIESLQEQVAELNLELSAYKTSPVNENQKGNSLFAEVDDQRQKMKQILQSQSQKYKEMHKMLNQQKMENRRLKRENENIKE